MLMANTIRIIQGNNLDSLSKLEPKSFRLIYLDPPFNTGRVQSRVISHHEIGDVESKTKRKGFQGKEYSVKTSKKMSYKDSFSDLSEFLYPRIELCKELLTDDGSIVIHLDYREVHDVKVFVMDSIFGKQNFKNEIIWAYDYGAKPKNRWPAKHDTLLWYVKDSKNYVFNFDQVDRVPYLAPNLVTKEKAEKGKIITDVWWNTIVCGKEKTGYPTQKPVAIVERFVKVNSYENDWLLDPFAGSGSFGEAAVAHNRNCILLDENDESIEVMRKRFKSNLFLNLEIE
jgi:site-specific DNA-methyltransferase (adenine-specific)